MNTNEELRARICSLEIQLNRSKREIDQQREEFLSKGAKTNNMLCDADARIAELEAVWQGRMQDAETAHQAELAATRKQLDSERLISKQLAEQVEHWRANHDNVVAKLRLFTQRDDLPVDRLPAYEYVLELENKLAEAQALLKRLSPLMINAGYVGANAEIQRSLRDVRIDLVRLDTPALDAAIAEAIEPYRKDAERLDLLGKLCKETPLRPNAFCSEIAPDTRLRYEFPILVSYDSVGQQISLRDAIDAAIAAKGESE